MPQRNLTAWMSLGYLSPESLVRHEKFSEASAAGEDFPKSWLGKQTTGRGKARGARTQVFGVHADDDGGAWEVPNFDKSDKVRSLIADALADHFVFSSLAGATTQTVVSAMELRTVDDTTEVITQGDKGDYFYVVERGELDVVIDGVKVVTMRRGQSFGEIALLYNSPRKATVRVAGGAEAVLWQLDRRTFQHILRDAASDQQKRTMEALATVSLLEALTSTQMGKLAKAATLNVYQKGDFILRKGEEGSIFYIIKDGSVECDSSGPVSSKDGASGSASDVNQGGQEEVGNKAPAASDGKPRPSVVIQQRARSKSTFRKLALGPGDYFGERALLQDVPRGADVIALEDDTVYVIKVE